MINVTLLTCSINALLNVKEAPLLLCSSKIYYIFTNLCIHQRNYFITHKPFKMQARRVKHNVRMFIFFQELNAQKQEMMQLEHDRGIRNNLLEYLRSFDPDVVMTQLLLNLYQLSVVK
jgi:hypothetical protein